MGFKSRLAADETKEEIEKAVLGDDQTAKYTEGKEIRKVIFVPGKIVNIVI